MRRNPFGVLEWHRVAMAISMVLVGCDGGTSTGGEGAPFTKASAGDAGTAGSAGTTGASAGAPGGNQAGAGAGGGSAAGSAGTSAGAAGLAAGGPSSGGTGGSSGSAGSGNTSGASAGTSGAGTGGAGGTPTGGVGGATGGAAGAELGEAGAGPVIADHPTKVEDPDALGEGPCASKTARDVLDAIHQAYPEFADITDFYDPRYIGVPKLVYPYTSDAGFSLVLASGKGDCPGGCIDWDYYYFQTDERCAPKQVGSYSAHSGPCNGYTVKGEPLWDMPDHTPTEICPSTP